MRNNDLDLSELFSRSDLISRSRLGRSELMSSMIGLTILDAIAIQNDKKCDDCDVCNGKCGDGNDEQL